MIVTVTHRRYVDFSHAHYAGNLVDEGLFAAYSNVTFHEPVRAGDVLEVTATVLVPIAAQVPTAASEDRP
jgi:3-aminobutyryl-CoA ammonia-lyase